MDNQKDKKFHILVPHPDKAGLNHQCQHYDYDEEAYQKHLAHMAAQQAEQAMNHQQLPESETTMIQEGARPQEGKVIDYTSHLVQLQAMMFGKQYQ